MAVFSGTIRSEALDMDTGITVVLPYDRPTEAQQNPCKVLYLFHGLGNNSGSWMRNSNVARYARDAGLAVVMPEVQRGFYTDMAMGLKYFTYTAYELPRLCEEMFRISPRREDTFVAGLSMGGYGAVKTAMSRPDKFSACASFSGVLDLNYVLNHEMAVREEGQIRALLGNDKTISPENDNYALGRAAARLPRDMQPRFLLTCGEQDYLRDVNLEYQGFLRDNGFDITYMEWQGGHDWDFWDRSVKIAIDYFLD